MGSEWSFTDIKGPERQTHTGVFCCYPRHCPGHTYRDSIPMQSTFISELELVKLVAMLEQEWPAKQYDTLTHNCCHFVNEFCQRLGVGGIPSWITHLAGVGAAAGDFTDMTCCRMVANQVTFQVDRVCCQETENEFSNGGYHCEVAAIPATSDGAQSPQDHKRSRRSDSGDDDDEDLGESP